MAGSLAEKVAYTPVMNPDESVAKDGDARGVGKQFNRLQLALCIVLLASVVLQFLAIVTPGWSIYSLNSVAAYESVYYSTACVKNEFKNESKETCKTMSHRDAFYSDYYGADDEQKAVKARQYNLIIQYQMNVQITWFIIVGTLIFQGYKLFNPQQTFPRATVVNIAVLTCGCPLMFQVLFKNFVEIDFRRKLSDVTELEVGFPYSFFFYILTFSMVIASVVVILKQVLDQLREKDRIHAEMKVKFDRLKLEYDAEVDAFKRYRQRNHLRPDSGGSYRSERRSRGDDRASHSPRHSREIRDFDRDYRRNGDHSPRPDDRSRDRHSPRPDDMSRGRHSPRPRDRSPPRAHRNGDRSPRPNYRHYSPPRDGDRGHPPRNRSPRPDEREHCRSRHRSPPRFDSSSSSEQKGKDPQNSGRNEMDQDNPVFFVTPSSETTPSIIVEFPAKQTIVNENSSDTIKGDDSAKTEDIELNVTNMV